jgi:DNA-binding LytR/AlgR family response regulator
VSRELFEHQSYKERFLIKIGHKLIPVQVSEIAWFRAEDRVVWLHTHEGKKYIINYTLTDLEQMLDPKLFFRLNRQYLASRVSVSELYPYFKGQVVVQLKPKSVDEIVVSRIQTPALKEWLDG